MDESEFCSHFVSEGENRSMSQKPVVTIEGIKNVALEERPPETAFP
jgi:hypothetical protein